MIMFSTQKGGTIMNLEWMGNYRDIVGNFYRSANGYSLICKIELFGDTVRFSPYEVQILEHIIEYADQRKNMKWYAAHLGLSQATYSKYVRKLVEKGLVEKYHASDNRKDVILMVSSLGMEEYQKYTRYMQENLFSDLFRFLDSLSPQELETTKKLFTILGRQHGEKSEPSDSSELIRID